MSTHGADGGNIKLRAPLHRAGGTAQSLKWLLPKRHPVTQFVIDGLAVAMALVVVMATAVGISAALFICLFVNL
jgi:hypothetical protein